MRRALLILLLILFSGLVFFQEIASFSIRMLAFHLFSSPIAFRHLSLQKGALVLDDVSLHFMRNDSLVGELSAPQIQITFLPRPKIHVDQPHLEMTQGNFSRTPFLFSHALWEVSNGTFIWKWQNEQKTKWKFDFKGGKLSIEDESKGTGTFCIHKNEEQMDVFCSFNHLDITPLSHLFIHQTFHGEFSGNLNFQITSLGLQEVKGNFQIENGEYVIDDIQWKVAAKNFSWDGVFHPKTLASHWDHLFSFSDPMKIQWENGSISCHDIVIDCLNGNLSSTLGLGVRFETQSPLFFCEGKIFSESRWLELNWRWREASGSLSAKEKSQGHSEWRAQIKEINVAEMLKLSPAVLPIEWEKGICSAIVSWQIDQNELNHCELIDFQGKDLSIEKEEDHFSCTSLEASFSEGQSTIRLADGQIRHKKIALSHLNGTSQMTGGHTAAHFMGDLNGMDAELCVHGPWKALTAIVTTKGDFSQYVSCFCDCKAFDPHHLDCRFLLKGSWDAFSVEAEGHFAENQTIQAWANVAYSDGWEIADGFLEANAFDLSDIAPFFSVNCQGAANFTIHYTPEKIHAQSSFSNVQIGLQNMLLQSEQLGENNPFHPGVEITLNRKTHQLAIESCIGHWTLASERLFLVPDKSKIEGDLRFHLSNEQCQIVLENALMDQIHFSGEFDFLLSDPNSFVFTSHHIEGSIPENALSLSGAFCGEEKGLWISGNWQVPISNWKWKWQGQLSQIQYRSFHDGKAFVTYSSDEGLIDCEHLRGIIDVGKASFAVSSNMLYKNELGWLFDFRVEDHLVDVARLSGVVEKIDNDFFLHLNSCKSHLFNMPLEVDSCRWGRDGIFQSLSMEWSFEMTAFKSMFSILNQIDNSLGRFSLLPILGKSKLVIDYDINKNSEIFWKGIDVSYEKNPIDCQFLLTKDAGKHFWQIQKLQINELSLTGEIEYQGDHLDLSKASLRLSDAIEAELSGRLDLFSECTLQLERCHVRASHTISSFFGPQLSGECDARGSFLAKWNNQLDFAFSIDIDPFHLQNDEWAIENRKSLHVEFGPQKKLLVRDIDFEFKRSNDENPIMECQVEWAQLDFSCKHWMFHRAHARLLSRDFSFLKQDKILSPFINLISGSTDASQTLEFLADIDCADDFSSLTCNMREGFVPLLGSVRHIQNLKLSSHFNRIVSTFSIMHAGHSVNVGMVVERKPVVRGRIFLEDEEQPLSNAQSPLTIAWELNPDKGVLIDSIEGSFGGVDAHFNAEKEGRLIGSARVNFALLSDMVPSRLGNVLHRLKMGNGYELMGIIHTDPCDLSKTHFEGLLSGKECELFGYQIQTLLTKISYSASDISFSNLRASDSAGRAKVDLLRVINDENDQLQLSIPSLIITEFRPCLLKKIDHKPDSIRPLVVREFQMTNFTGNIDDDSTYRAEGKLSFINSFKREHTVFDLPSDVLGRIVGLDGELLVPVEGQFQFSIHDKRVWFSHLEEAYSEGRRSKFFLVQEKLSPSMDLDGNLHVFVTMKQYVLFKITENFLLTIYGTLENPSFHLQKKSKLLGIWDR